MYENEFTLLTILNAHEQKKQQKNIVRLSYCDFGWIDSPGELRLQGRRV